MRQPVVSKRNNTARRIDCTTTGETKMQIKSNKVVGAILGTALLFGCAAFTTPANAGFGARIWIGGPAPIYRGPVYHGDWDGRGGNQGDPGNWVGGDDGYNFGDGWDSDAGAIVWHGSVDDKVDLYFHGSQWTADVLSGKSLEDQHVRFYQPLPFDREQVHLARVDGRGRVFIFQQPTRENGYTVGVRIYDPQPDRS